MSPRTQTKTEIAGELRYQRIDDATLAMAQHLAENVDSAPEAIIAAGNVLGGLLGANIVLDPARFDEALKVTFARVEKLARQAMTMRVNMFGEGQQNQVQK